MKHIVKTLLLLGAISLTLGIHSGCSSGDRAKSITIKGSDTMVILGQRWAEVYMSKNPGSVIQVTGGGSGTGIAALINGTTDICQSSRPMKDSEKKELQKRFNISGVEIPVAKDGLSIYLNTSNLVEELSLVQLEQIYTGKITNWSQVGGPNAKIVLYGRENNSGTYVYFKEHVLKDADYAPNTQSLPGTGAVVNAIAKDRYGIGYGGAAYGKGIKEIKVKKDAESPAYKPSLETIKSEQYPIARNLFFYLRNKPTSDVKRFIDWVLGPEGQQIVTKVGYYPVR